ncbi:acyltransferase [Paenibacillus sp. HB172176]|uniref:acyltransferase n=1 Tax=Paenibacillus sp. HB172176 TaxID=2493690 RepID=UPI001439F6B7|nr:acyltransferase [Paenibacillus sp. HB172176]
MIVVKIAREMRKQARSRGLLITIIMNMAHLIACLRALRYRVLYPSNLKASLFAMQAGSSIEINNRNARMAIGRFVFIRKNTSIRLDDEARLTLGDKVFINDNCTINCANDIQIGAYTKIAPNVCMNDHDHNFKHEEEGHLLKGKVSIGEHVWIGANCVILRDTIIGDHAVIGAGSVVKGVVPAYTLFVNKREKSYSSLKEHQSQIAVGRARETV